MPKQAANGSMNVSDSAVGGSEYTDGSGPHSKSGGTRVNTTDTTPGVYAKDGALRAVIATSDGALAPGVGRYTPTGALRMCGPGATNTYNTNGIYAKDGSLKVTVL